MKHDQENENNFLQTYIERCKEKTPTFFKKLRLAGLILVAAGATIVASPITIPAGIVTVAAYLIVAGSVATAVSQAAVENEDGKSETR